MSPEAPAKAIARFLTERAVTIQYWWDNFDIAMDGTCFRSANDVYGRTFTSTDSVTHAFWLVVGMTSDYRLGRLCGSLKAQGNP